jgi:hypothetical protein
MGYFVKNRRLASGSTSVVVPSGTSDTRPDEPVFGSFRFNTDIGTLEFFNGTMFKSVAIAGEADLAVVTFTMTTTATDVEQVIVFVGAIYQNPTTYSITGSGNDITFTQAPPTGETVNVIHNLAATPSV